MLTAILNANFAYFCTLCKFHFKKKVIIVQLTYQDMLLKKRHEFIIKYRTQKQNLDPHDQIV